MLLLIERHVTKVNKELKREKEKVALIPQNDNEKTED